ncbi:hypothetical protein E2C01_017601 [Portunus trituberculatus]|uniref:Uncharacterized protein n=1 Tax=Portunus trituberculatus TaxID=210409 RepID=A0A5B7DSZ2_PORTR|nr:hypothetical protein [Portunus trituberculatus]
MVVMGLWRPRDTERAGGASRGCGGSGSEEAEGRQLLRDFSRCRKTQNVEMISATNCRARKQKNLTNWCQTAGKVKRGTRPHIDRRRKAGKEASNQTPSPSSATHSRGVKDRVKLIHLCFIRIQNVNVRR